MGSGSTERGFSCLRVGIFEDWEAGGILQLQGYRCRKSSPDLTGSRIRTFLNWSRVFNWLRERVVIRIHVGSIH